MKQKGYTVLMSRILGPRFDDSWELDNPSWGNIMMLFRSCGNTGDGNFHGAGYSELPASCEVPRSTYTTRKCAVFASQLLLSSSLNR